MKKFGKIVSLVLSSAMVISLAACGKETTSEPVVVQNGDAAQSAQVTANKDSGKTLSGINIGTWWVQYYDSDDKMEDSADWVNAQDKEGQDAATLETNAFNRRVAQAKWDNVKKLESKYGFKYYWQNLTYSGVQDSINTSIIAGTPDCEIYLVDTGMAIPAQLNGLALDLKTVLPADSDLLSNQLVTSYLDLGDGKACILMKQQAQTLVEATYPLAFNMQMIAEAGLEDPRVLWEKGEWTWDTFNDYCEALTKDTDGDGQIDQYGYSGYMMETFEQLMMSNGANIAQGKDQKLDSPATIEALQQMYDMYNTYGYCYPYAYGETDENRLNYTAHHAAFFPQAAWIAAQNGDYDWDGSLGYTLNYDTAFVRWPVGPHGDKDTNPGKNLTAGEFYIIPAGVAEPEKVYNFLYDYWNWYDGDISFRDDTKTLNWWYSTTAKDKNLQVENFEVMKDCGAHSTFDLWNTLGVGYDFESLINGSVTPAQFAETYKNEVQSALDAMYK